MRKALTWFSLTVITIFSVYISLRLSRVLVGAPTYEGISSIILRGTADVTAANNATVSIIFRDRNYDTLCLGLLFFTVVSVAADLFIENVNVVSCIKIISKFFVNITKVNKEKEQR